MALTLNSRKYASSTFKPAHVAYSPPAPYRRATTRPASLNAGVDATPALAKPRAAYTGSAMLGVATMHKSNAVPVFSPAEAKDLATMRRG